MVTASDGTVYNITPIAGGAKLLVMNSLNTLHNEVKKYPASVDESINLQSLNANWLVCPLNANFTKERLSTLSKEVAPVRIFAVLDRSCQIKEFRSSFQETLNSQ